MAKKKVLGRTSALEPSGSSVKRSRTATPLSRERDGFAARKLARANSENKSSASSPETLSQHAEEATVRTEMEVEGVSNSEGVEATVEPRVRKGNNILPSERMKEYLYEWSLKSQKTILEREEGPKFPISCQTCCKAFTDPSRDHVYRCFDCFEPPLQCSECIVRTHRHNPFHRVEDWDPDERFWKRISLADLPDDHRLTLNLGHGGSPCPLNNGPSKRRLTIVHGHGIHTYPVRFCHCPQEPSCDYIAYPTQLTRVGLWPGSWKMPETAYTISGLRDYQLISWQCMISAHDYVQYLVRSTDNVCPENVPDRYREFMTAAREFSFARITKRAGVSAGPNLPAGCLAVLCPPCPQPGINLDPVYERGQRAPEERFLEAHYHNCDGNFQQTQKDKPLDENDKALTDNGAYIVNTLDFKTFQANRPRDIKENTTCNKFGAMGYSRYAGRITGTMSLSCSRHMFALPLGSLDMDQGEAHAFADFIHCSALQRYFSLPIFFSGYDINCQYRIHFAERIATMRLKFGGLSSIPKTDFPPTICAVGKFHLPAHIASCRYKFSYNFLPGAGMTDGEGQERKWSVWNGLALRTKEMTTGHAHDVKNDVENDMNIRRVHNLARDLSKKYENAVKQLDLVKTHFEGVRKNFTPEEETAMAAEEEAWLRDVVDLKKHKGLSNIYEQKVDRGLTTKELLTELGKSRSTTHGNDPALAVLDAVYEGVELQSLRENLLDALEEDDGGEDTRHAIEHARKEFFERYSNWTTTYNTSIQPLLDAAAQELKLSVEGSRVFNPTSRFPLNDGSANEPEVKAKATRKSQGLPTLRDPTKRGEAWQEIFAVEIPLPSSFDIQVLRMKAASTMVTWEKKVREAQANDALNNLRTHIITSEMLKIKKMDAVGKIATTRVGKKIQRKYDDLNASAEEYRRARVALRALGMDDADPRFRRLRTQDTVKFPLSTTKDELGQSRREVSWIWEDLSFVDSQPDGKFKEFYEDVRRVHWFRSKALLQRWTEESKLLAEEMRRSIRFFGYFRRKWLRDAAAFEIGGELGWAAYARKQAHRHVRLMEKSHAAFTAAGLTIETSLWHLSRHENECMEDVD